MARLVVTRPFAGYVRGDHITDADDIKKVLKGDHALNVVAVANEPAEDSE